MEVEPPHLQPVFARHCHAHNCAEPDPPTSRLPLLGGRGGAFTPPARQRRARSCPSPLCPQPMPCRIRLDTPHHPRTASTLLLDAKTSQELPRRHTSCP
uniref:Uncharacterized protein n=1 Tax=Oryza rufipogon TaxID=4529 RepID=A0A0E0QPY0_ORYRU